MKLSVLMALCRRDSVCFLDQAFASVWTKQSKKPDEIVLVLDGPLSNELDTAVSAWVHRIGVSLRLLRLESNVGLGGALNAGLKICTGDVVARMDADDVAEPERFLKQVQEFEVDGELAVLGSTAICIDAEGSRTGVMSVPLTNDAIYRWIWACPFIHPSVMFRRKQVLDVGSYSAKHRTRQDYDLWFRCAAAGYSMRNLDMPLVRYRRSAQAKNRRWSVVWGQVRIGLIGCRRIKAPLPQWFAVISPLCMYFLPSKVAERLRSGMKFRS